MYKFSNYNIVNINEKGKNYIYNVLTKKCNLLEEEIYNIVKNNNIERIVRDGKLLKLMLTNGYIIKDKDDELDMVEYKYHEISYKLDTLEITMIMTHSCNFNCIYCYQTGLSTPITEESAEKILKFIEKKINNGVKRIYINWFGGEPLMEYHMVEQLSRDILELSRRKGASYIGRITTNGYLLNKIMFEKLLATHILVFIVTLDGTKDYHDRQRMLKDGSGTYDTIMSNLKEIRNIKRNFIFDIRVNVSENNYNEMENFINKFNINFGQYRQFNLVFEAVHDWHGERIQEHLEQVVSDVSKIAALYKLSARKHIELQSYLKYDEAIQFCPASKKNGFVITGDAFVYKCEMAMNDKNLKSDNCIGYIDKNGNMIVDEKKEARWLTRSRELEKCYNCVAYPYCMGGGQCNFGIKFQKKSRCNDNKEFLRFSSAILSETEKKCLYFDEDGEKNE